MGLRCSCCPEFKQRGYESLNGSNNSPCDSSSENEDEESDYGEGKRVSVGILQPDLGATYTFIDGALESSLDSSLLNPSENGQVASAELQVFHGEDKSNDGVYDTKMLQCQGVTAQTVKIQGDVDFTFITNNETGNKSSKAREIFNSMKRMLQLRYKQDLMPRLPWMPQYICQLKQTGPNELVEETRAWVLRLSTLYVRLAMCPRGKYGENFDEQAIELQNIFDEIQSPETRILVEGPPAYGKSTMALKVCQDWANGVEEYTKCFELVILIQLRNFKANSFWKMLIDATRVSTPNIKDEDIRDVIERNAAKTLLILDGYDELPYGKRQLLQALLHGDELSEITVMVTSRPGSHSESCICSDHETQGTPRPDSLLMTFEQVDSCTYFYSLFQKRIIIKGIENAEQKQFLCKHLSHAFSTSQLDKLNTFLAQNYDRKLFECPLFLLLVAILSIETNLLEAPKNRTDLFKNLFNFIVKRGLSSMEDYQGNVDLFNYESDEAPFYISLLAAFGEFALDSVKQRQLTFTEEEILQYFTDGDNRILKLGFMTFKDALHGVKHSTWYEPVHRTLLEFAAAYYLYYLWKCGNIEEFKSKVKSLEPFLPDKSRQMDTLVFTFLSGLMKQDPKVLFDSLLPFCSKYTYWWDAHYKSFLLETELSEALLDALLPFITKDWFINCDRDISFCHSLLHEKIVERGLQKDKIKVIKWDVCSSARFPPNLKIPSLVLHISRQSNFAYRLQCQKIACSDLYCVLSGDELTRMKKRKWLELIGLMKTIHFTRISFDFSSPCTLKFLPFVLEEAKKGYLRNQAFRRVKCELKEKKNQLLKQILILIEIAKVEEIHITLRHSRPTKMSMSTTPWKQNDDELSKKLWADFIHRIAENPYVKVFILENHNRNSSVLIDESSLKGSGRKQWRTVIVEGFINLYVLKRNSQFEHIAQGDAGGTAYIRARFKDK